MQMPERGHTDYVRMASIQKDAAVNIINASLKADENCFRKRHDDALDRLYEAVQAELTQRQMPLIEQPPVLN